MTRRKTSRRKTKRKTTRRKTKRKTTRRKTKRRTSRRKSKRKTTRRKSKRKTSRRKSKKKVPFGGYGIDFTNCHDTLEEVFGNKPVSPPQMTKLIWKYIKRKRIASKP